MGMRTIIRKQGFSLVELTVVVVIIGVLITIGVPRFKSSVEKAKAREGLSYLHQVELQQARYLAAHGRYAANFRELESGTGESLDPPESFDRSSITSNNWERRWQTRLTRNGASSGFGRYTIWWNQDGYMERTSSIPDTIKPDLGSTSSGPSCSGPFPNSRGIKDRR
jgi:prepilin-type N-terminal cleavage/methylation domain-containing protein